MRVLRTPESCFASVPDFPHEPRYFTSRLFGADVRMCYYIVEPGGGASAKLWSGETVLLTHGEPTWSFLNRKLVRPLTDAGHRVVMFDQVGFGRSDKPADSSDYTSARHVAWNEDLLINHLDLRRVTLLAQDWGGTLALRVAVRAPLRFRRIVLTGTFLPTGSGELGRVAKEGFAWKKFAFKSRLEGGIIGQMVAGSMPLSEAERRAYEAPFPDESYKAGARAFPELVPTPDDDPTGRPVRAGRAEHEAAWAVFARWTRPVLTAFCETDTVMLGYDELWQKYCLGCRGQKHCRLKGGGHFVQEALGPELVGVILEFITVNPVTGDGEGAWSRL